MNRILSTVLATLIVCFCVVFEVSAEADSPARFERGHHEFGAEFGYGTGYNIPGSGDKTDLQFAHLAANFQLDLTGTIGKSFYQGNLNWYAELRADLLHHPSFGTLFGFSPLMFQYKFIKPKRKWAPTILVGAGLSLTDWDDKNLAWREISGDLQFLLHGGVGIEYFRPGRGSFAINYRYLHISNAGMDSPNVGLNAGLFTLSFNF